MEEILKASYPLKTQFPKILFIQFLIDLYSKTQIFKIVFFIEANTINLWNILIYNHIVKFLRHLFNMPYRQPTVSKSLVKKINETAEKQLTLSKMNFT